jgi:hypothetical protein
MADISEPVQEYMVTWTVQATITYRAKIDVPKDVGIAAVDGNPDEWLAALEDEGHMDDSVVHERDVYSWDLQRER